MDAIQQLFQYYLDQLGIKTIYPKENMGLLRSLGSRQGKISDTWKAASISSNNELKHESLSSQGGMG